MSQFKDLVRTGGLVLAFAVVSAGAAQAQEPQQPRQEAPACEARVQPVAVTRQADPVDVRATYTEAIGKVTAALIDAESKAKVLEVREAAESGPSEPAVEVRLDLSEAVAGEWTLSFQGESGRCTGKVTVQAAGESAR